MTPILAEGIVTHHLTKANIEAYITDYLENLNNVFPEEFKFVRIGHPTPQEVYWEVANNTKNRRNKKIYDMSQTDTYMVRLVFRLGKTEIVKPLFLPYVNAAGICTIRDAKYLISPFVADKALSVGDNNIFIKIGKTKLTFRRNLYHFFTSDGRREISNIVWSRIYDVNSKKRLLCYTSNAHYMFCKHGLLGTFQLFTNTKIECGYEFDESRYPRDKWVICESMGIRPQLIGGYYIPSQIKIAIRREDYSLVNIDLIAAFFYVVDHFPDRVIPEEVNDVTIWHSLLGYIIFGDSESEGRILNSTQIHLSSVDVYLDAIDKAVFQKRNIFVNDIYELLFYIMRSFPKLLAESSETIASMNNKELSVLRPVLSDIIKCFNYINFSIDKEINKGKTLTPNTINNILMRKLPTNIFTRVNTADHPEVTSISSSSDNIIWKLTATTVLQSNVTGFTNAGKSAKIDPSTILDASIAYRSSYSHNTKTDPSGRKQLNPYALCNIDGTYVDNPKFADVLARTQADFRR